MLETTRSRTMASFGTQCLLFIYIRKRSHMTTNFWTIWQTDGLTSLNCGLLSTVLQWW